MPQEREAQSDLAAFYKFTSLGQGIAGRVEKGGSNDNGEFITLKPCITRDDRASSWVRADPHALGLTTDLALKIDRQRDVGRYFVIEFMETEPSKRGQPKKLFRVTELTRDEIVKLRDGELRLPEYVAKARETATTQGALSDDF